MGDVSRVVVVVQGVARGVIALRGMVETLALLSTRMVALTSRALINLIKWRSLTKEKESLLCVLDVGNRAILGPTAQTR